MKLSEFGFELPQERIALFPPDERDHCRLLVLDRKSGAIQHLQFPNILDFFDDKDSIILNNTQVFPAKLVGNKEKTNARIEVFLLRELHHEMNLWDVLVDPARKIRIGNKLFFGDGDFLEAEVIDNTTSRGRTIRFLYDGRDERVPLKDVLYQLGKTPLPKCIDREVVPEDEENYQTVYASVEGAVAAPAAGIHFTKHLLKRLEIKGVDLGFLTLHISLGSFREVEVEDLSKFKMDSEQLILGEQTCDQINKANDAKKHICAVGVSTLKALETAHTTHGHVTPFDGWTNRFIFPPYEFHVANMLLTNFHEPFSTYLMAVAAFGGYKNVMNAYQEAIKEGYNFGPYGDAMLII